jgi:hypothetical protein
MISGIFWNGPEEIYFTETRTAEDVRFQSLFVDLARESAGRVEVPSTAGVTDKSWIWREKPPDAESPLGKNPRKRGRIPALVLFTRCWDA